MYRTINLPDADLAQLIERMKLQKAQTIDYLQTRFELTAVQAIEVEYLLRMQLEDQTSEIVLPDGLAATEYGWIA